MLIPVILCGGTGTRLWPLSRTPLPRPGKLPLETIEIQSGGYLGEDDIRRFSTADDGKAH